MEVPLTYNDLEFLRIACQIAIKEFRFNPEMEGKYGPTATGQAIRKFQDLESRLEAKILSV